MRADRPRRVFQRVFPALAAFAAGLAALATSVPAHAFCRTTTCGLPANFAPTPGQCVPPDFEARCASLDPPVKVLPVYWKNACVSYDIQKDGSRQVPYGTAVTLFAQAFGKWTGTSCTGSSPGRVSVDMTNLGPVDCDQVQYSSDQGNQHVIVFRDTDWEHDDGGDTAATDGEDSSNTLALTTITFDPDTGEIYDADMEINSTPTKPLALGDPVPADSYDFQSIIQHETGHFLGMAHSGDDAATMYALYRVGSTSMRVLSPDDTAGLCSIYLPNGSRAVDPSVAASGAVAEDACDPTPRHGFQSACAQPVHHGCSLSAPPPPAGIGGRGSAALAVAGLVVIAGARRRARAARMW